MFLDFSGCTSLRPSISVHLRGVSIARPFALQIETQTFILYAFSVYRIFICTKMTGLQEQCNFYHFMSSPKSLKVHCCPTGSYTLFYKVETVSFCKQSSLQVISKAGTKMFKFSASCSCKSHHTGPKLWPQNFCYQFRHKRRSSTCKAPKMPLCYPSHRPAPCSHHFKFCHSTIQSSTGNCFELL